MESMATGGQALDISAFAQLLSVGLQFFYCHMHILTINMSCFPQEKKGEK